MPRKKIDVTGIYNIKADITLDNFFIDGLVNMLGDLSKSEVNGSIRLRFAPKIDGKESGRKIILVFRNDRG